MTVERTNVQIRRIISALTTAFIAAVLVVGLGAISVQTADAVTYQTQPGKWIKQSGKWWYDYDASVGKEYPAGEWLTVNGKNYHFNSAGWMNTGWYKENGKWYWLGSDGAAKTGWNKIGGKWYYMNSDTTMATGWQKVSGKWYYLTNSGAMKTGWLKDGTNWYYLIGSGAMKTGWLKTGGKWYYLNPSDGKIATGFYKVGNATYYSNGSGAMQTGWKQISNKWYCFNQSGAMKVGTWAGNYYLNADGTMATSGWVDNGKYYVDGSGKWVKNPTKAQLATKPGNNNASSSHVHSFTDEYVWQDNVGKPVHSWPAYFAWTSPGNRPLFSSSKDASYVASAAGYNHGFYGNFSIKKCSCGKYRYTYNGIETDVNHLCTLDVITLKATNNETSSTLTTTVPSHPCPTCNRLYSFDELKDETPHNYIYAEAIEEHVKRELRIGDPYLPATDPAVTTYSIDGEVVSHATYIETLKKYAQMCGLLTEL